MNKEVRIILSDDAQEVYNYLNKQAPVSKIERSILNSINTKKNLLRITYIMASQLLKTKFHQNM